MSGFLSPTQGRRRPRRPRSTLASLGIILVGFEVIALGLGALVANGLHVVDAVWAFGGGSAIIATMIVGAALLPKTAGIVLGTLAHVLSLLTGLVMPAMWVVGALFLLIWLYCVWQGVRVDRERVEYERRMPGEGL